MKVYDSYQNRKRGAGEGDAGLEPDEQVMLLREIRDALVTRPDERARDQELHQPVRRLTAPAHRREGEPVARERRHELKEAADDLVTYLDHKNLNELEPFVEEQNPSAENLARFILERLAVRLDDDRVKIYKVRCFETPTSVATYQVE